MQEERRRQAEHVRRVVARLAAECGAWFPARAAKSAKNETVTRLMQLCLFPRCVFTPADALYCAEFVHTVHSLRTPNFSTLLCYDRVSAQIMYLQYTTVTIFMNKTNDRSVCCSCSATSHTR